MSAQIILTDIDQDLSDYLVTRDENIKNKIISSNEYLDWSRYFIDYVEENLTRKDIELALIRPKNNVSDKYLNLLSIMLMDSNEESIQTLEMLLQDDEYASNVWLFCFLSSLYFYNNDDEKSLIYVEKVLNQYPNFSAAIDLKISLNRNQGNYEENFQLFEILHSRFSDLECDYLLMEMYIHIGHKEQARSFYLSRKKPNNWMKLLYCDILINEGKDAEISSLLKNIEGEEYEAYKRRITADVSLFNGNYIQAEGVYLEYCFQMSYNQDALMELLDFYSRYRDYDKISLTLERYGKRLDFLNARVYDWYVRNGVYLDGITSPVELYQLLSLDEFEFYNEICRIEGW